MRTILLVNFLAFFLASAATAQEARINFEEARLETVFKEIEARSGILFNYNPDLLAPYIFSGSLDLDGSEKSIEKVLHATPFTFELKDATALIFTAPPKEYRFCAYLKEEGTNLPLAYANVYTEGREKTGTQSDANGYFELLLTCEKNRPVTISYIGYESRTEMIQDWASSECRTIRLQPDLDLFGTEIIVTDYLLDGITEGETYSSVEIDLTRLGRQHTNIEQDLLKTVQFLPGVTGIDDSAANIQIRGGTSDQNLVLWEGATLYNPGHLFGMITGVNPFVVQDVKVFKGVFHPQYDNRVGGIVDISLRDSVAKELTLGVGTTLTESHAYLEVPVWKDRLSLLVSGRNSLYNLWETPTFDTYSQKVFQETRVTEAFEEKEEEQDLSFYDLNAKIIFRPSRNLQVAGAYFRSQNDFDYQYSAFDDNFISQDDVFSVSELGSLTLDYTWTEKLKSSLSLSSSNFSELFNFSLLERENADTFIVESQKVTNSIQDNTIRLANQYDFSEKLSGHFGYSYNRKEVLFEIDNFFLFERDFFESETVQADFHDFFGALDFKSEKWLINGGMKATRHNTFQQWYFSPRLSLQYAFSKHLKVRFSAGVLQQFISKAASFGVNELGVNSEVWTFSADEENTHQRARKISGGLVLQKDGWLLDVELYYNKTNGLSTLNPLFNSNLELADFSFGEATARGIDVLLKKRFGFYSFWLNYSRSEVDYFFEDISEDIFPGSNDQRNNLSVINSFDFKDWTFSLSYRFRTGLPFSEPSEVLEYEDDEGFLVYEIFHETFNSERLEDYSRWDASVRYRPQFKNDKNRFEASLSLLNLTNRENIFSREFRLVDLEESDFEPELYSIDRFMLGRTVQGLVRFWF